MSINDVNSKNAAPSPLRHIHKRASGNSAARGSRSSSAPARMGNKRRRRRLVIEDHYRVDPNDKTLLPGLPVSEDDFEREMHDFWNLVALVPVVVLNIINWNWDILLDFGSKKTMQQAWTGEWFPLFYAVTIGYFLADLIWVLLEPRCVKSPGVIILHHVATILYLIIPYRFPDTRWLMGACMCVETNTWLLIARRVFNKQGFGPWVIKFSFLSIRIKLISILFYVTWISIRCCLYPFIMKVLWTIWFTQWEKKGVIFNTRWAVALLLHFIFCWLNFKWTFDLFMSKWRASRSGMTAKVQKGL